jgi:hypothetical protein
MERPQLLLVVRFAPSRLSTQAARSICHLERKLYAALAD